MTPLAAYLLLFLAVGVGFILVHLLAGKMIRPNKPDAEKGTIYECGEPTIGSAWIQFDLRFYVVALLFVIFDVEVAFFFPWAEVFGKANAVANAEAPKTAAEHREYARLALDLAAPAAGDSRDPKLSGDRARYEALLHVTEADLDLRTTLTRAQVESLRKVSPGEVPALQALTDEQRAALKKLTAEELAAIDTTSNKELTELSPAAKKTLKKLAPEDLPEVEKATPGLRAVVDPLPVKDNQDKARELAWVAFGEVLVFFGVLLVGFAYLWRRGDLAWVRSMSAREGAPAPGPDGANGAPANRPLAGVGAGTSAGVKAPSPVH